MAALLSSNKQEIGRCLENQRMSIVHEGMVATSLAGEHSSVHKDVGGESALCTSVYTGVGAVHRIVGGKIPDYNAICMGVGAV